MGFNFSDGKKYLWCIFLVPVGEAGDDRAVPWILLELVGDDKVVPYVLLELGRSGRLKAERSLLN